MAWIFITAYCFAFHDRLERFYDPTNDDRGLDAEAKEALAAAKKAQQAGNEESGVELTSVVVTEDGNSEGATGNGSAAKAEKEEAEEEEGPHGGDPGAILLDGVDLRELDVGWLRDQIGLVSQEPVLFNASVRDNITFGADGFSDAEVSAAAKAANAHDFVSSFPDGYDTSVGARGTQISGGQKQRIAIARAILKKPKILLLDEATSALDSESEVIVQQALDNLIADRGASRTTIVVAHRLSTIRNADCIFVVENSTGTAEHGACVVEAGTHEELMARPDGPSQFR